MRVLVVTAVAAERDAVVAAAGAGAAVRRQSPPAAPGVLALDLREVALPTGPVLLDVLAAGTGPAAAAAATATALALAPGGHGLVVSAGIAGGFADVVPVGGTVVASEILAADLGADTGEGFADAAALGFGVVAHRPPRALARAVAATAGAVLAPVLTVSTVTGTAARAAELAARHRGAAAEAMEGFGVASAAALHGVPFLEIRAVSNAVGPRDRAAWRVAEALAALTRTFTAVAPVLRDGADGAVPHEEQP
ncbi:futalosine hydrolase [Streptomyces avicenniae]|uniref:futalosine hydrolase n=1 Tax=Streptomyces avicenniae TaxID=500153 RepID=UPI00069C75A4|nr:futalosine hydrolase [Streptomyces avicenniae]